MSGIELFERIKQVSTFGELLQDDVIYKTSREKQSKSGNYFEKMWDIIIKFGFNSNLSNDEYDHYTGNINTCKLTKVVDLETYLQNMLIYSKGKEGGHKRYYITK